ncbi:uncharacterized protein [Manis javanica]|uniref:uncharacterized protein isoform X3 n=1 Tax=Manis javanica TaxID=9974 RepID=UPI003C6CEC79
MPIITTQYALGIFPSHDSPINDNDDHLPDTSAKMTEESIDPDLENASSIEFVTLCQHESALTSLYSSNDDISDVDKPSTSKQGSEMMRKVSPENPNHHKWCQWSFKKTGYKIGL